MGLLKKLFGGADAGGAAPPPSSQFHESESTVQQAGSSNAPRRELIQVVMRDTMRKHGIPSDWMECRILSVVTRKRLAGMHVQFIVTRGQPRLLEFVPAFQESFWEEIGKYEPRAREWLFSLAWQFDAAAPRATDTAADADGWADADTQPHDAPPDELASDLQALYAIRDAALNQSAEPGGPASGPATRDPRTS